VARLAEAHPRREVCGFVVRRGSGGVEAIEIPNAAGPERAAGAFAMDAGEQLRTLTRLAREGGEVLAIFHSHLEAPAEPSARDVADAFCGGEPLWPGVEQIVVSVRSGQVAEVRRYRAAGGTLRPVEEPGTN
jgi:[CysO sulfur-carrier protein]-S-L-cysteine hydrolase